MSPIMPVPNNARERERSVPGTGRAIGRSIDATGPWWASWSTSNRGGGRAGEFREGPGGRQTPRPERFEPPADGRLQIVA